MVETISEGQLPLTDPESALRPAFGPYGALDAAGASLGRECRRDPASAQSVGRFYVLSERVPRHHASSPRTPWRSRSGPLADLGTHALGHIAVGLDTGYTHFSLSYADSAFAAFERECRDYHGLGGCDGLDDPHHPEPAARPAAGLPRPRLVGVSP